MLLKYLTTTLVVAGLALLLLWPFAVGARPKSAPRQVQVEWGQRALVYFGVTCGVWLSCATSALFLVRQSRRNLIDWQRDNLKSLVEGTLHDHGRNR